MKYPIKILFAITVLTSISFSIINAFFAPIAIQKEVNESILGIIISSYSVLVIAMTPFVSGIVERFSRRNIFLFTLLLQAVFTLFYGIIPYIEDYYYFVWISIALRSIHGIASAFNINLLISTAALLSDREEVNSNFAMIDLGWMFGKFCGPTITSFMYSLGGIFYTFLFCSLVLLASLYYAFQIDFKESETANKKCLKSKENFFSTLRKLDIFMLFFSQFLNVLSKTFFGPIIFSHINTKFSMSLENASKLLSLSFISYYFTVYNIDSFIKRFGTKLCIAFGVVLNCIAVNLLHPVSILPQSAILIALGFFILGFPSGCIDIPIMSDLVITMKETHHYPENLANDITSAIYTFANYMGESLGPIYGGFFPYSYDFEFSCVLTGLLNLLFLFLFAFMNKRLIFNKSAKSSDEIEYSFIKNNASNESFDYDNEKSLLYEQIKNGNKEDYVPETLSLHSDLKEKLI